MAARFITFLLLLFIVLPWGVPAQGPALSPKASSKAQKATSKLPPARPQATISRVSSDAPLAAKARPVIVIDPGHGGHHKGGSAVVNGKRIYEKEVTLAIAFRIERLIKGQGRYDVRLTRRDDTYVGLAERTERAENFRGDLFVSLHTNAVEGSASRKASAKGLEFWVWSPEGSRSAAAKWIESFENEEGQNVSAAKPVLNQMMIDALTSQTVDSRRFASQLERAFLRDSKVKASYRGIDGARFKVLENYSMPSVLIEYGFLTNPTESRLLADSGYQQKMAERTVEGINAYMEALKAEGARAAQVARRSPGK